MAHWKKLGTKVGLIVALVGAGILSGAAVYEVVMPTPVAAECENDECEGGNRCKINSTTGCDVVETGGCKTVACERVKA